MWYNFSFFLFLLSIIIAASDYQDDGSATVHKVTVAEGAPADALCGEILLLVEKHVEKQNGWAVQRHARFPTTDIPVKDIPALQTIADRILQTDIGPAICALYGLAPNCLIAHDLFIVKYSAEVEGGQRALALHQDESHFSFNLLLSRTSEFDGGGTYFAHTGRVVCVERGQACVHPGLLFHRGEEITRGIRYLLVGFLQDKRRLLVKKPKPGPPMLISPSQKKVLS